MNKIKELKNVTEKELNKILESEISLSVKHFGNQINVDINKSGIVFRKSKGDIVSIVDLLVSDIYYKPINYLKNRKDFRTFINERLVYDYINEKLITYSANFKTDDFLVKEEKHIHNFDKSVLKKGSEEILNSLGFKDKLVTVFVNNAKDEKYPYFKISNVSEFKTNEISDISKLIYNDVLMSVDLFKLKFVEPSSDENETYINIVNFIFENYINTTQKNIATQDFDLPNFLKSSVADKKHLLSENISSLIDDSQSLYDLYTICLIMFKNSHIKSNDYISHQGHRKQYEINQLIKKIGCNQVEFSIPTFSEFISEKG